MRSILQVSRRFFCDLNQKNRVFLRKMRKFEKQASIHEKVSQIDEKKMADFVHHTPPQKIAYQMANKTTYDKQLKDFIDKFNIKHKNKITLLDFSNYITELGDLKDKPLKKEDIQLIKQFQKRKVDQRVSELSKKVGEKLQQNYEYSSMTDVEKKLFTPSENEDDQKLQQEEDEQISADEQDLEEGQYGSSSFVDETEKTHQQYFQQGPFRVLDSFVIILLNVRSNTKITTLNRINSVKTLLFMGNGNGIISYAKGKGQNANQSLGRALFQLKKNIIAIPRDSRNTLPLAISKRFQDYWLYLRPKPGFNAHGHPLIAFMLTLAGIDHCAFHVAHTQKNVYNVLKVFFKAITLNTTPQQLAEREGFKVYRHQFIRPLTHVNTHASITGQAHVRDYKRLRMKNKLSFTQR